MKLSIVTICRNTFGWLSVFKTQISNGERLSCIQIAASQKHINPFQVKVLILSIPK